MNDSCHLTSNSKASNSCIRRAAQRVNCGVEGIPKLKVWASEIQHNCGNIFFSQLNLLFSIKLGDLIEFHIYIN